MEAMSKHIAQPRSLLVLPPRFEGQTDEQRRREEIDFAAEVAMERHKLNPEMYDRKGRQRGHGIR